MKNKRLILILFILVATAQLYVPISMIMESEEIVDEGRVYKFRTRPIDPVDPLRGRYVVLNFQNNYIEIPGDSIYYEGQDIFVILKKDASGFMDIDHLVQEKPIGDIDFVNAKVGSLIYRNNTSKIHVIYPFNRYYMEEFKAPLAEEIQNDAARDSTTVTYVEVKVKEGRAVIQDIIVDGISIDDLVMDPR